MKTQKNSLNKAFKKLTPFNPNEKVKGKKKK